MVAPRRPHTARRTAHRSPWHSSVHACAPACIVAALAVARRLPAAQTAVSLPAALRSADRREALIGAVEIHEGCVGGIGDLQDRVELSATLSRTPCRAAYRTLFRTSARMSAFSSARGFTASLLHFHVPLPLSLPSHHPQPLTPIVRRGLLRCFSPSFALSSATIAASLSSSPLCHCRPSRLDSPTHMLPLALRLVWGPRSNAFVLPSRRSRHCGTIDCDTTSLSPILPLSYLPSRRSPLSATSASTIAPPSAASTPSLALATVSSRREPHPYGHITVLCNHPCLPCD